MLFRSSEYEKVETAYRAVIDKFNEKINDIQEYKNEAYILSETLKTEFHVCTGIKTLFHLNGKEISASKESIPCLLEVRRIAMV